MMRKKFDSREDVIKEFHEAFGAAVQEEATEELVILRYNLIQEECYELLGALNCVVTDLAHDQPIDKKLWVQVLDGMADLQVVLSGTAVALKPLRKFEEAFYRVHESNMSKLGEDGKPILREDGKILKGPNYKPPQLEDLVD